VPQKIEQKITKYSDNLGFYVSIVLGLLSYACILYIYVTKQDLDDGFALRNQELRIRPNCWFHDVEFPSSQVNLPTIIMSGLHLSKFFPEKHQKLGIQGSSLLTEM